MSGGPCLSHHTVVLLPSVLSSFSSSSTLHGSRISTLTSSQLQIQWKRVPIIGSQSPRVHPYWANLVNTFLIVTRGIWCAHWLSLSQMYTSWNPWLSSSENQVLWDWRKCGSLKENLGGLPKEGWNGSWVDKSIICPLQSPTADRKRLSNGACGADQTAETRCWFCPGP